MVRRPPRSRGQGSGKGRGFRLRDSDFGLREKQNGKKKRQGVWPCLLCLSLSYEAESIS